MNQAIANSIRQPAATGRGAALFVATLDAASLPDMGDRSLDRETQGVIRPRRRAAAPAVQKVRRRAGLPFPEPRLPDVGMAPAAEVSAAPHRVRIDAAQSQTQNVAAMSARHPLARVLFAGPTVVAPPTARETTIVSAPPFDMNRAETVVRRGAREATGDSQALRRQLLGRQTERKTEPVGRFASLEENIAVMSRERPVRIALLGIGVQQGMLETANRLAEMLQGAYSRNVEVVAAEKLGGLKMARALHSSHSGDICLVAAHAENPHRTLPYLESFDGVILVVEIGKTPADAAAAWADALRQGDMSLLGVLAT